ncbi:hypothetical protein [Brachybacterium sp. ACRRE]|uniref:trypsin-like serine peptidase n=1 Tax=Brachybacterium sp. ACRRE TaxID=2918184 RepID=UPI001EF1BD6F|nr:hypothetical protein [Brachybacterium sp. ACRRE]
MIIPRTVSESSSRPGSSRLRRCLHLAGGGLFAAGLVMGSASFAGADPGDNDWGGESHAPSVTEQKAAADYWTPERMENAKSADSLVADKDVPSGDVASSDPSTVPSQKADPAVQKSVQKQAATDGAETAAAGGTDHIGKVFFTQGGTDYVCSGNAVSSGNKSTVATAGHCTNEDGAWATNWTFVPGYDHGDAPYGKWTASDLYSTQQWISSEDMNYDAAFAVVSPESGSASLTDTVGGSAVAFNAERGQQYTSYGYPAAAPFDGESLENCQGTAFDDTLGDTDDQGIDCDMTGGSSGGPWFLGGDASGAQNSVNSFGYTSQANVMYGPYFGDVIQSTYQQAASS